MTEGFPEKVKGRLFEPLSRKTAFFGGEYDIKNLVEMMEGKVVPASNVGNVTTVTFQITDTSQGDVEKSKEPAGERSGSSVPIRILVVEDEKINALVICAMLRKLGRTVSLATNGLQALRMIKEFDFDCIFMDIQMPEMDGVEATRAIRLSTKDRSKRVPIIALTAHAMTGDKERFIAAGMDDYLTKPVEMARLVEVLRRLRC